MPNPNPKLENLTNAGKGRPRKQSKTITLRLEQELCRKLDDFCATTKISRTEGIELLIKQYLPSAWYEWELRKTKKK